MSLKSFFGCTLVIIKDIITYIYFLTKLKETNIATLLSQIELCVLTDSGLLHGASRHHWSLSCGQKGQQKASGHELATHQEGCSSPQQRGRMQTDA